MLFLSIEIQHKQILLSILLLYLLTMGFISDSKKKIDLRIETIRDHEQYDPFETPGFRRYICNKNWDIPCTKMSDYCIKNHVITLVGTLMYLCISLHKGLSTLIRTKYLHRLTAFRACVVAASLGRRGRNERTAVLLLRSTYLFIRKWRNGCELKK